MPGQRRLIGEGNGGRDGRGRDLLSLHIAFLRAVPSAEANRKLTTFRTEVNDSRVHAREVCRIRRRMMSDFPFSGALLEKVSGMPATMWELDHRQDRCQEAGREAHRYSVTTSECGGVPLSDHICSRQTRRVRPRWQRKNTQQKIPQELS